ncbi:unnamed protein product [Nezara viridula]|uniref:RRM domain-containing protein n=1 Tax=Nezara viridula TaxID=85310 RepID=A0A9P0MUS4_NEZVI|nr:unnamed protein product [Nezara viridula]
MAAPIKNQKNLAALNDDKELINKEHTDTASNISSNHLNAPKHGTVIPNRVFVGGISPSTTELDLVHLFSSYGNVTGTKIISDRAGVSKGYGFVTFETEEEAKRLQKDAENIVLGQRRLNIAPAIKKQSFGRSTYDCSAGGPVSPSQLYRQNGVTYAFHNGMAFFQQPTPSLPPSAHIEHMPVFQSGPPYGAMTPSSPGPAYPFPYAPQGQLFYQAPQYQYHVPQYEGYYEASQVMVTGLYNCDFQQYEGCYEASQVMVTDGSLVIPQYYLTHQPTPELAFYQPATVHPQEASPQSVPPLLYASPRTYESAIIYSTEGGGRGGSRGGGNAKWLPVPKEEELGLSQALTPPVTPRNPDTAAVTGTTNGPDDVVQSIQGLSL